MAIRAFRRDVNLSKVVIHHTATIGLSGNQINQNTLASEQFGAAWDILIDSDGSYGLTPRWTYALNPENFTEGVHLYKLFKYDTHHLSAATQDATLNEIAIHVAVVGNFDVNTPTGYQHSALSRLLQYIQTRYTISDILYASDVAPVTSPGNLFFEKGSLGIAERIPITARSVSFELLTPTTTFRFAVTPTVRPRERRKTFDPRFGTGATAVDNKITTYVPVVPVVPPTLDAPLLYLPANNSTGSVVNPLLQWYSASAATYYGVEVATSSSFGATTLFSGSTSIGQLVQPIPSNLLQANAIYYWRVKAYNATLSSAYSETWNFTTELAVFAFITSNVVIKYDDFDVTGYGIPSAGSVQVAYEDFGTVQYQSPTAPSMSVFITP